MGRITPAHCPSLTLLTTLEMALRKTASERKLIHAIRSHHYYFCRYAGGQGRSHRGGSGVFGHQISTSDRRGIVFLEFTYLEPAQSMVKRSDKGSHRGSSDLGVFRVVFVLCAGLRSRSSTQNTPLNIPPSLQTWIGGLRAVDQFI